MTKPNILIVLTDQQRFDSIAAAGYPHMDTPNMDRLVHEGCLFRNAYSPNPICVPARHCLLTGLTPRFHGYYGNAQQPIADSGIPTLPRCLADHGYHTAALGKSHFIPVTEHHGYSELRLMEELPTDVEDDYYARYLRDCGYGDIRNIHGVRVPLYHEPQDCFVSEEQHGTPWLGREAASWIHQNAHRPFMLTVGFIQPHPPWNIPESQRGRYANADLPEPHPQARTLPFPEESWSYQDDESSAAKRAIREAYYTSISMVDDALGDILSALDEKGLTDNTIIVFTSDHGEMLQDRGMYQKMTPYEGSARIPFIVRYPRCFGAGTEDTRFVDLMDIFPTVLEVTDLDYHYKPAHEKYTLAGGSLIPESNMAGKRSRTLQTSECYDGRYRWVMARNDRYKFIHFYRGGHEYVYDLLTDPGESINCIGTDACPESVVQELRRAALSYEDELGEPGRVADGDFISCINNEEGEEPDCYSSFDWNNGDKFPRWAFMAFQHFGRLSGPEEARLFLDEFIRSVGYRGGKEVLRSLPIPDEGKLLMREAFVNLGGDPADLDAVWS